MIVVTYGIDKALYDNPRNIHNIVLTTTMHSFQMKKLVHVQLGKLLQNRLEDRLRGKLGSSEQFMLENEKGSIEPLTRDEFEKKLQRFDSKHTVKEQEILESYCYIDQRNQQEIVQIAITIKDDCMEAVIDFDSIAQYENFVQPAWLVSLNDCKMPGEFIAHVACMDL